MKSDNKIIGAGLLTATAASLCCITPLLALVAGAGGAASAFSWIEPFRPYLIGITVLVLGFAWFQKLKPAPREDIDCDCETDEKPRFFQSKMFLGIATVFSLLMLAFPLYAGIFYPAADNQVKVVDESRWETVAYTISGMTCTGCEEHVNHEVSKLPGIAEVHTSYEDGKAVVKFDETITHESEILKAINSTGYTVTGQQQN